MIVINEELLLSTMFNLCADETEAMALVCRRFNRVYESCAHGLSIMPSTKVSAALLLSFIHLSL